MFPLCCAVRALWALVWRCDVMVPIAAFAVWMSCLHAAFAFPGIDMGHCPRPAVDPWHIGKVAPQPVGPRSILTFLNGSQNNLMGVNRWCHLSRSLSFCTVLLYSRTACFPSWQPPSSEVQLLLGAVANQVVLGSSVTWTWQTVVRLFSPYSSSRKDGRESEAMETDPRGHV